MGKLFVVSAPSGAGKTTLCRRVLEAVPDLRYSVSYTTRPPRPGEEHGRDYFFVSREVFQGMIDRGEFLEWAEVFGRYYGTGRGWVESQLEQGLDVLVDIDIAGARQIRERMPEAAFIFVIPPTFRELVRRLETRHTETDEQVRIRLARARDEFAALDMYDYLVVNDDLERATADLECLFRSERLRLERQRGFRRKFFEDAD